MAGFSFGVRLLTLPSMFLAVWLGVLCSGDCGIPLLSLEAWIDSFVVELLSVLRFWLLTYGRSCDSLF